MHSDAHLTVVAELSAIWLDARHTAL